MKISLPFRLLSRSIAPIVLLALTAAAPAQRGFAAWGTDLYGQMSLPTDLKGLVQLKMGSFHAAALMADGTVRCWGSGQYGNAWGQCDVPPGLKDVVEVSPGWYNTAARKRDGTVVVWGSQEGTPMPTNLKNVVQLASGWAGNLALKADGTVAYWGRQVVQGLPDGYMNPPAGLKDVVQVAQGVAIGIALRKNGTVVTWGDHRQGDWKTPSAVKNVAQVAAGQGFVAALTHGGKVYVWGNNINGVCDVPSGLEGVVEIATGGFHMVARRQDGSLAVWGKDEGQVAVPAWLDGVVSLSAHHSGTFALRAVDVSLPAVELRPGEGMRGMVTLPIAPPPDSGGADVALASSNSFLKVNRTVHVEEGEHTATFPIRMSEGIAPTDRFTISATYRGAKSSAEMKAKSPLELSAASLVGGSTSALTATLFLTPSPERRQVALTSDDPNVRPPTTVTIAANKGSVTFPIRHFRVGESRTAQITASLGGEGVARESVILTPARAAIELPGSRMWIGTSIVGRLVLDAPLADDVTVTLRSSKNSVLSVPPTVRIPAGDRSVEFAVRAAEDLALDADADVIARFNGGESRVTLRVMLDSMTVTLPAEVTESWFFGSLGSPRLLPFDAKLTFADPLTEVMRVDVSVEGPVYLYQPYFNVPAGATAYSTLGFAAPKSVTEPTPAVFTFRSPLGTQRCTVMIMPIALASITAAPTDVKGGESVELTLSLTGCNRQSRTISLASSSADIEVPATVTIAPIELGQNGWRPVQSITIKVPTRAVTKAKTVKIVATFGGVSKECRIALTP